MTNAVILSTILTIIYITVITVAADLYPPLKEFLANTFSHHWIGKSVTAIVIFVLFKVIVLSLKPKIKTAFLLNWLTIISVLATLVILAFFTWETQR